MNWRKLVSVGTGEVVDRRCELVLTVIQVRRFRLRFVEVDFCASEIDVRLNSYSHN